MINSLNTWTALILLAIVHAASTASNSHSFRPLASQATDEQESLNALKDAINFVSQNTGVVVNVADFGGFLVKYSDKTIEKSSGMLVKETKSATAAERMEYGDCIISSQYNEGEGWGVGLRFSETGKYYYNVKVGMQYQEYMHKPIIKLRPITIDIDGAEIQLQLWDMAVKPNDVSQYVILTNVESLAAAASSNVDMEWPLKVTEYRGIHAKSGVVDQVDGAYQVSLYLLDYNKVEHIHKQIEFTFMEYISVFGNRNACQYKN